MYCRKCGAEIDDEAIICPKCGCATGVSFPKYRDENASPKSRLVALLFCGFFGMIGVHRFYAGKVGTGIAMIFTLGGLGIWAFIDFILIACGSFKDSDGMVISSWRI